MDLLREVSFNYVWMRPVSLVFPTFVEMLFRKIDRTKEKFGLRIGAEGNGSVLRGVIGEGSFRADGRST